MITWIDKLASSNTTAVAPVGDHGLRGCQVRQSAPGSYRDCIRPKALGRIAGPGKPRATRPPLKQQMCESIQTKCKKLEDKLASLQTTNATWLHVFESQQLKIHTLSYKFAFVGIIMCKPTYKPTYMTMYLPLINGLDVQSWHNYTTTFTM